MRRALSSLAFVSLLFAAQSLNAQELEGEVKALTWVGYQHLEDVARVFVKTNEPVTYRVEKRGNKGVTLVLENTRVPILNNSRPLDTQFFDGPVRYIEPRVIDDPSPSVRIEITLRSLVPYQEIQNDTYLALDFTR